MCEKGAAQRHIHARHNPAAQTATARKKMAAPRPRWMEAWPRGKRLAKVRLGAASSARIRHRRRFAHMSKVTTSHENEVQYLVGNGGHTPSSPSHQAPVYTPYLSLLKSGMQRLLELLNPAVGPPNLILDLEGSLESLESCRNKTPRTR